MPEFASWRSFHDFARSVQTDLRYVRYAAAEDFLATVLATCVGRETTIKPGANFWRAQLGQESRTVSEKVEGSDEQIEREEDCPHPASRMKPIPNWSGEGRANPRGIPYLYLATERETALAEVRPWVGSRASIGLFQVRRSLTVIDCSRNHSDTMFYFKEPSAPERERAVWSSIDRAFAAPVERTDDVADYIPTQIIAELFKHKGYDGIAYKSAFGKKGFNIALFDIGAAVLTYCELHEVKGIDFKFDQCANPYWIRSTPTASS
jgi:hypothetical protein